MHYGWPSKQSLVVDEATKISTSMLYNLEVLPRLILKNHDAEILLFGSNLTDAEWKQFVVNNSNIQFLTIKDSTLCLGMFKVLAKLTNLKTDNKMLQFQHII